MSTTEYSAEAATSDLGERGRYWREQLNHSHEVFKKWEDRGQKIVARYRDERPIGGELNSRFNILWSNVAVLRPSLYGRAAKPEVSRRYSDADPIGRLASTMLERVLDYEIHQFPDFDNGMGSVVEDRLLPGRGTVWMRFEGFDENGSQITDDEESGASGIAEAHAPVDYIYWQDFRHSPARAWDEVWWVARAVYLTLDEGIARFGEVFKSVPLSEYQEDHSKPASDKSNTTTFAEKAKVWEIWDKRSRNVCWIADNYPEALDERPDPLELEEFFPCPMPLYATTTNGSLIPVPDYTEYQDQAAELDSITARIDHLVDAVRAAGVYNGEYKELARLLQSKGNILIPVTNWGGFSEKGGLKGAMELVDLSTIVTALSTLYKARDTVIQTIYEVSGISDVQRGTTKAEETLGAQQLKVNFGSLRLKTSQTDVARFASDIFRLKAQIICKLYPPPLIAKMSGILETPEGQDQQAVIQALQLLSSSAIRDFHITVESDSLAQIDDDAEKAAANEAIIAIGKFMAEWLPVVGQIPQIIPMVSEMLLFLIRRYRAGRQLESVIEQSMKQLQQAAMAPKGPSKEQMDAQMQAQSDQMRIQADTQAAQMKEQFAAQAQTAKLQAEGQLEQLKMQMEQQKTAYEAQIEAEASAREQELEWRKANLDAETKLRISEMDNQTKLEIASKTADAATTSAQISSDTTLKTAEMNTAAKIATAKPLEDPKAKADAEMPMKQLEASTDIRIAELEKEAMGQSAALTATGQMFALGKGQPQPEKKPEPAAEPKKPTRWKIMRDANGKMSELVPAED